MCCSAYAAADPPLIVDLQPKMHGHNSLGMSQFSSQQRSEGHEVAEKLLRQEEHTAVYCQLLTTRQTNDVSHLPSNHHKS